MTINHFSNLFSSRWREPKPSVIFHKVIQTQRYKSIEFVVVMTSNFSRGSLTVFFQGLESIPCKEIGYILRTLGQNPTEDEILNIGKNKNCKQTAAGDSCPVLPDLIFNVY